jgi:ABC transporter DrrB family efflux protein
MSTIGAALQRTQPLAPGRALTDSYLLAGRYARRLVRTPQLVVFQTVQPVMFMLLFVYVFGGTIHTELDYVDFLIPGVLVQATLFGGGTTTVGLAQDLSEGMFDRFRSLPMTRPAVLVGRTIADVLKNAVVLALLLAVASAIGFRFHQAALADLAAVALVLVFAYAFSWIYASIALLVRDPEAAQVAAFVPTFPLVFASSAFVPTENMPHWLQLFAEHQPVSITVNAVRALAETGHAGTLPLTSLAWSAGIVLLAAPLAISRYRRLQ